MCDYIMIETSMITDQDNILSNKWTTEMPI